MYGNCILYHSIIVPLWFLLCFFPRYMGSEFSSFFSSPLLLVLGFLYSPSISSGIFSHSISVSDSSPKSSLTSSLSFLCLCFFVLCFQISVTQIPVFFLLKRTSLTDLLMSSFSFMHFLDTPVINNAYICDKVYIGQTRKCLNYRYLEH